MMDLPRDELNFDDSNLKEAPLAHEAPVETTPKSVSVRHSSSAVEESPTLEGPEES
jgi:hypothetical protein